MNTPWVRIMEEFRGRRLAVHDDIARGRTINMADTNVQNALGWLAYHHLVWRNASGQLQVRDVNEAQHLWRSGPCKEAQAVFTEPAAAAAPAPQPERPRVHDHQAQLFGA